MIRTHVQRADHHDCLLLFQSVRFLDTTRSEDHDSQVHFLSYQLQQFWAEEKLGLKQNIIILHHNISCPNYQSIEVNF